MSDRDPVGEARVPGSPDDPDGSAAAAGPAGSEIVGDLAAYALDALDPETRRQVEARLRDGADPELTRLLAEYRAVVALLPHAAAPRAVPAGAWEAVLARIHGDRGARSPGGAPGSVSASIVPLEGTGRPGASARLFLDPDGRRGWLAVAGLPPVPGDRVYQFWFARPGQPPVSGATFRVDPAGRAAAPVVLPGPLADVGAVAATEEAAPGSPRPTGLHLLDGRP